MRGREACRPVWGPGGRKHASGRGAAGAKAGKVAEGGVTRRAGEVVRAV